MGKDEVFFAALGLRPCQIFDQAQREDRSGTWIYDCTTGAYWWSRQVYRIYGLHRGVVLDQELFLSRVHQEDLPQTEEAFRGVLLGKPYHFVHRIWVKGEEKWLEQRGRLYTGKDCTAPYVLGTVRDVTDIRRRETRLARKRADYAAITEYLAETTDTTDLAAIVASVKRTIRKRMDVALIAVFVRQNEQIVRVIPKAMDPLQAFLFQDTRDFVGYQTVQTGQRHVCPVAEYPTRLGREALAAMGAQCVTALPIKHGRETIGALAVVTCHEGNLSREEHELCRTICGYLSNQLNNALLYARLKQELALRTRLESDQEVIFNESVDYISIIESDGRFSQINPAFARRLGFSPEALVGRSVFDFIHPEDRGYAWHVFNGLPAAGLARGFRNRFLCQNGEIGYLENNLKYMPETGSTIAIARDLTDQREMEERNTLLEQTVVFERSKSEFFAGLSHEFKTPLNIILSTLDLVGKKSSLEDEERFAREYEKFFGYAYQNCYKLLRLTSNLLDVGKLENGYYPLHVSLVPLDKLLQRVTDAAEVYAAAKGVALDYRGPGEEVLLACDEDCVERILLNLISNAIKNNHVGGKVHVQLRQEPDFVCIQVDDNGVGIPAEELPHIFDKFMTSRHTNSGQREGSGIGLSLVRSLVELHGGTVTAESRVDEGSRFSFTLPRTLLPTGEGDRTGGSVTSLARLELSDVK